MLPNLISEQQNKGYKQLQHQGKVREFQPSSQVMVRSYNTQNKWVPGIITNKVGEMHYDVSVNGISTRRHIDQLKPCWTDQNQNSPVGQNYAADQHTADQPFSSNDENQPTPQNSGTQRVLPNRITRGIPPERFQIY